MKQLIYPNLTNEHQFKLNKINEIKEYFNAEIRERELMSKRLSKYIASFDSFNHEDFAIIVNEERNCRELKEIIRMMKSERSETDKDNLIEEGKRTGIDKITKCNEIINNNLKSST